MSVYQGPFVLVAMGLSCLLCVHACGDAHEKEVIRYVRFQVDQSVAYGIVEGDRIRELYVTLEPGDLIYTGTMGRTSAMRPGDVVEVELEGVGVLKNGVTATL